MRFRLNLLSFVIKGWHICRAILEFARRNAGSAAINKPSCNSDSGICSFCLQIALTCILFYTINSCGIEHIPILQPPVKGDTSDPDDFFKFGVNSENKDPDNNSRFFGFEIYYRFFSENDPLIYSQQSHQTIEELTANKFLRVNYYTSGSDADTLSKRNIPLVKTPLFPQVSLGSPGDTRKTAEFTIHFESLSTTEEPYIAIPALDVYDLDDTDNSDILPDIPDDPPYNLIIRRNVEYLPDEPDYFKPFNKIDALDSDLAGVDIDNQVMIILYVVSYGKYQLSTTLFSTTVCLSFITIPLPTG